MTWTLPDGRRVEQRGDIWIIYDRSGRVLYVGDDEGALEWLSDQGVAA